jgi:rhodanese-related sulfurtransferase
MATAMSRRCAGWLHFGWMVAAGVVALAGPAAAGHGAPAGPMPVISAPDLKALLDRGGARPLLIDLRPADDFRQGRLPGARSIPIRELRRRAGYLPPGRIVLYCACPKDELEAAYRYLTDLGLLEVQALEDGFPGWTQRGYPLER